MTEITLVASFLSENVRSNSLRVFIREVTKAIEDRARRLATDTQLADMISRWEKEDGELLRPCYHLPDESIVLQ